MSVEETPVSDPGVVGVGLMTVGGLGILGGIGLGAASLTRPDDDFQPEPPPTASDLRTAAAISTGLGLGLFTVGAAIFVLDPTPSVLSGWKVYLGPTGGGCVVSF